VARVLIVVPCYNEAKRLDVEAFRAFALPGHDVEFRFVDDGSTDETVARLNGMSVQRLERNFGKAEAVRRGVLAALAEKPDYVGYWDADLSAPLSELGAFVTLCESRPDVDVVIGSRVKLMGRSIERLAWRHYLGRFGATLVSLTLDLPIYDTQCGAKLFRVTDLLARVFAEPFLTRWVFDVEILARLLSMEPRSAAAIYELPLDQWTFAPGSKVKPGDFGRALVDLATIKRRYRI